MEIDRRNFNKGALASAVSIGIASAVHKTAHGQTGPIRLPLHEFVADTSKLTALRNGVKAMKARKPSDPLSWTFQAAIHGYTDELLKEWEKDDPDVAKIDHKRYWNQCPHFGQNSANFLPWHRAYTHHFEEILRFHTGDSNFALPYWDISAESQRTFPREFGIEHLDGDVTNDDPANINPLFHRQRDYFLCGYEHPFTDQLPLVDLSKRATDDSRAMNTPVFFGDDEASGLGGGVYDAETSTRGILEQAPHDQIHRAVGGQVAGTTFPDDGSAPIPGTSVGGMAIPMTAGYDPIFSVHHANMDRLWAKWSCMTGKSWGKLPDKAWFHEKPWYFFDAGANEINLPRKDYFDHRALDVRFKDEDLSCVPLKLPPDVLSPDITVASNSAGLVAASSVSTLENREKIVLSSLSASSVRFTGSADISSDEVKAFVSNSKENGEQAKKIQVLIEDLKIGQLTKNGYDVFLVPDAEDTSTLRSDHHGYLGSISLFVHSMNDGMKFSQLFDATKAWKSGGADTESHKVVFVPYRLTTDPKVPDTPIEFGSDELEAAGIILRFIM